MNRLTRLEEAMTRMSTGARTRTEGLRAQLLRLLEERDLSSSELVRVTHDIIELLGHDMAGTRRIAADLSSKELLAANLWLQNDYWTGRSGLFGGSITPWRELLVQVSIDW